MYGSRPLPTLARKLFRTVTTQFKILPHVQIHCSTCACDQVNNTEKNQNEFPSKFWALIDHILGFLSQTQKSK